MTKKLVLLFVLILINYSCTREKAAVSPEVFVPENPYSTWSECKTNVVMSSKYCKPLLPSLED